jgi:hypothetical protein
MATTASRYDINPGTSALSQYSPYAGIKPTTQDTTGTQNTTGTQVANTSQNQTSNQTQTTNQTTQNMTPASLAALEALIRQLMGGGTTEMRQDRATRDAETDQVRNIRSSYSKPNAFIDAEGLMSQQMRRTMEQLIPAISRAAEDAGSSGGALRALLLQDAAQRAAESSSALGAQQAVSYGGIAVNLSQVMENLTRPDDPATAALLSALGIARGAIQNTQGTVVTNGTQNTTGTTTTNTSGNQTSGQQQNTGYTTYAPMINSNLSDFGSNFTQQPLFVDPARYAGASNAAEVTRMQMDALSQDRSAWADFRF